MPRFLNYAAGAIAPLTVLLALGCNSLLGDFDVGPSSIVEDGGATLPDVDSSVPPAPGCKAAQADANSGVFVETGGEDKTNCGATDQPCKTIQQGQRERFRLMRRSEAERLGASVACEEGRPSYMQLGE